MEYPRSKQYQIPKLMDKIMGPNPIKLEEELLQDHKIAEGATVCDLGSGMGLTSVFLAKEYGFRVYAADLWSDPEENRKFFHEMGMTDDQLIPVKADAEALPFEKEFFDAVVSTDSYNYFGRDPKYLDEKLLPFLKKGVKKSGQFFCPDFFIGFSFRGHVLPRSRCCASAWRSSWDQRRRAPA